MEQFWSQIFASTFIPEVVARSCSIGKVWPATLLKCEIFKNTFVDRTPVAASFILKSLDFINYFAVNCLSS